MNTVARIVHISDVHFGRIKDTAIVESLVRQVNLLSPTVVVVSGDLTQRARTKQWKDSVSFLRSFESPSFVIAGNHDVYPWWYPHLRLTVPLRRYRKYVSENLDPHFVDNNLCIVGVNSSHGWTVKAGRFTEEGIKHAGKVFGAEGDGRFKVLVVHHHLFHPKGIEPYDVAGRGQVLLEKIASEKVDLVLCGHLHESNVESVVVGGTNIVVASAGTATSDRGRGNDRDDNRFFVIDVAESRFTVREKTYREKSGFVDSATHSFDRE